MNIRIVKSRIFHTGTQPYSVLSMMGTCAVYVRAGNKKIAIVHDGRLTGHVIQNVLIATPIKEPLWRQHMNIQMGRGIRQSYEDKVFRVKMLDEREIMKSRFEVYEIVYGG